MKYWKPYGERNEANEEKLKEWMEKNGISTAPGMIVMFIYVDIYEEARMKAVRDLGLIDKEKRVGGR